MTVRVINLEYDLYQGSYSELDLDYPNYVNGVWEPIDISSAVITCKLRKTASSPVVLSLTTADASIVVTALGKFRLKFATAATSAIAEKGNVVYQAHVEVTLGGVTRRTHQILVTWSPEINV